MFIYKIICSLLILASSCGAFAVEDKVQAQDNINYVITYYRRLSDAKLQACLAEITELAKQTGNGHFDYLAKMHISLVNLSSQAAETVAKMDCVKRISPEKGEYEAQPRTGRQNATAISCEETILDSEDEN